MRRRWRPVPGVHTGPSGLAVGAVLVVATLNVGELRTGMVMTVAAALAGMALGWLLSRLTDKPTAFYPIWFYFCVEAVGAALRVTTA